MVVILLSLLLIVNLVTNIVDYARGVEVAKNYEEPRERFFNDGRFYGWDRWHHEWHGKIDELKDGCFDNGKVRLCHN